MDIYIYRWIYRYRYRYAYIYIYNAILAEIASDVRHARKTALKVDPCYVCVYRQIYVCMYVCIYHLYYIYIHKLISPRSPPTSATLAKRR